MMDLFQNVFRNRFDEGYEIEDILGVKDSEHGILYLIKWKERDEFELVPALLTFIHVPNLVVRFYATR